MGKQEYPFRTESGNAYAVRYVGGKAKSYTLLLPCDCRSKAELSAEGMFDRAAKKAGIAKEYQTGDPEFDAAVYVGCDDPVVNRALTLHADDREGLKDALTYELKRITISKDKIEATYKRLLERDEDDRPIIVAELQRLEAIADGLATIATRLPPAAMAGPKYGRTLSAPFIILTSAFGVALSLLQFWATPRAWWGTPLDGWGAFVASLPYSGALILLAAIWFLKSGRESAMGHRRALVGTLLAALLFVPLISGAFRLLNAGLDDGEAQQFELRVLDRHRTGGRSKSYYLVVPEWRDETKRMHLPVTGVIYRNANIGQDCVALQMRRGAFGFDWIENREILRSCGTIAN